MLHTPRRVTCYALIDQAHMRQATISRTTKETSIELALAIDGSGVADVQTGIGFYDHMLTLCASHGLFDLRVAADGDLHVDEHHTG